MNLCFGSVCGMTREELEEIASGLTDDAECAVVASQMILAMGMKDDQGGDDQTSTGHSIL